MRTLAGNQVTRQTLPEITLFHVSPRANQVNIANDGVQPCFSKGKARRSWWVNSDNVSWAIAHVALHHDVKVSEIDVWRITKPRAMFHAARWPGIYYTDFPILPESCFSAQYALEGVERMIDGGLLEVYSGNAWGVE